MDTGGSFRSHEGAQTCLNYAPNWSRVLFM